ncbi:sigma-54-dependent Fis family transcriptional regulator [Azohydromonas caseinilytica]|uniref:Sigma-54-dependent Fis family transcriptional regulator n=1 Tax=Azohydromonas caseinilytica TaxID=2728836 RepID=A0A848F8U2_9BURK|nr:sigma-54-dependent Fis family transcriptional regulator [Azohydromonas caseinilytica]NML16557.1 sigma-54-dependent Fis family transcriptional regulator [Azohydromonas caseinilytica]
MPDALTRHIDTVIAVGSGALAVRAPEPESLFHKSWARCMTQHGLDPTRPTPARILPSAAVREHRQRMEGFLRVARSGMEDMYRRVADLGYMLLLTDADGIAVDYIGNPAMEPQLKRAGLYIGADWNEAHAGTCGVGTCLIERTTITCHREEHFDATHISLTCTSSPLYAPDGELLGVLDVSALKSPDARDSQHLVWHLTTMYAQMIEDANFLRSFGHCWILRLGRTRGMVEVSGELMLAFDEDGIVVGANTGARRQFWQTLQGGRDAAGLIGTPLTELLDISPNVLWGLARGHSAPEVATRFPHHGHRFFPSVIAPRTRAGSVLRMPPPHSVMVEEARPVLGALDRLAEDDPLMQQLIHQAKRLVDSGVALLIQGETGAGKEVLAKALHEHSRRASKPFVAVNCASIPESLIESELFGYTPGTFTGGRSKGMKGLIAQSDGGTLFLDEIGDMPLHLQTRLLRVLSESEVLPLGADKPVPVTLNVIAATHRDLREAIERGAFREDLYYRLCGAALRLPPLRERRDLGYLVRTLFQEEARRLDLQAAGLTSEALALLQAHRWPGNVRELRNVLRYALALSGGQPVTPAELPAEIVHAAAAPRAVTVAPAAAATGPETACDDQGQRLLQALRRHKWSITAAAQELGLCRATVYRQMKRYGITPPNQL